ncbi:DUF2163 domain-containing protein [Aliiroseovarius sp.]|uniref:DUF2163 domain-containing protein n=1 Tax=Aliiroseovarius sp. TaxID=1872442 RepID=UPI00262DF2C8|nr:DUF2163 domain-containing protein [Aliiroseovarius sp.]
MTLSAEFEAHLASGLTSVARCFRLERRDGTVHGFTDHDVDLTFGGTRYKADTGLTARALQQTTGLSIDNTEALGALSDASVSEADIRAGRYDGARVEAWLVNWNDTDQRLMQFRGTIGEVTRGAGGFQAELQGLTEALNQPQGRAYQAPCSAVLGDGRCGFDFDAVPGYQAEVAVEVVKAGVIFRFAELSGFTDRWFEKGRFEVLTGPAAGLVGVVKNDRLSSDGREIELWEALRAPVSTGDMLRIQAGCDKRFETCRLKFDNAVSFRGFPHIPGEDWLMTTPVAPATNGGGALVVASTGTAGSGGGDD